MLFSRLGFAVGSPIIMIIIIIIVIMMMIIIIIIMAIIVATYLPLTMLWSAGMGG